MYEELILDLRNWSEAFGKDPNPWGPVPIKRLRAAADAIEKLQGQRGECGEWIRCGDGENVPYQCSHCGKTVPANLVEKWVGVKYCPMCGAPMDKSATRKHEYYQML